MVLVSVSVKPVVARPEVLDGSGMIGVTEMPPVVVALREV